MKRFLSALIMMLSILTCVFAEAYGFRSFGTNPFLAESYSDRFQDALVGPYNLPKVENDSIFYFTTVMSEEWDLDELERGGKLSWIQNSKTEIEASFVGKNLALTAYSATYFSNRRELPDPMYDIWNTLAIQLDYGLSFDWFSFGATMRGGSEMVRMDRAVSGWANAMENAYFSSFRHVDGHDFFSLGLGVAVDTGIFSSSFSVGDIITIRDEDLYTGWDAIADSASFSLALRYPEFTKRGDLNLLRPRMSWSMEGNPLGHNMTTAIKGELLFQMLPELGLSIAFGYRETGHSWFRFDADNGLFMTGVSVMGENFAVNVIMNVATDSWRTFCPALSFTWMR